jgi:HlyD family secretion protein
MMLPKDKKSNRPVFIGIGIVIALLLLALLFSPKKAVDAIYTIVQKRDALETVLGNGRIAGSRVMSLSFIASGIVKKIPVAEGANVRIGDTLVILDNSEQRNMIEQRKNAVVSARINLQKLATSDASQAQEQLKQAASRESLAKTNFERSKSLADSGAFTKADLDKARQDYEMAVSQRKITEEALALVGGKQRQLLQSQFDQASAVLREALLSLARTVLLAPENGRVVKLLVAAGETVSPGAPVLSFLESDTTTHVELLVDETEIGKIKVGQKALVSVASHPDQVYNGRVRDIVPLIDASRGTATVQLVLDTVLNNILPDQTVSAQIIVGSVPNAILIEQKYLGFSKDIASVFVVQKKRAVKKTVSVKDAGNGYFIVVSGLSAGDTIVSSPLLKNGERVKLVR